MAINPPQNIVIIGGGIAGVSTAYFLSISPSLSPNTHITLVEGTKIAAGASGYSGGFLAKDWHGSATASLAAMSYDLHGKLAKELGGEKRGYRTVETLVGFNQLEMGYEADWGSKSKRTQLPSRRSHHLSHGFRKD